MDLNSIGETIYLYLPFPQLNFSIFGNHGLRDFPLPFVAQAFWKGAIMGFGPCILTKVCCAPFMGDATCFRQKWDDSGKQKRSK